MNMGYLLFFSTSYHPSPERSSRMEPMELDYAETIIGVGHEYNMKHALKCFEIAHWAKKENGEQDLIPLVIKAKNTIMQNLIIQQKKQFRFFEIESPYENTCPKCKGSGEIYKFFKKSVKVNCHICGGSSKVEIQCPTCEKTPGRFIKRWKEGGGVNLKCKKCNGTMKVKVSCQDCRGKGKIKKAVLSDELKSTTPCKKCYQLGFLTEHQTKKSKKKKFTKHHHTPFQPFPIKSRDGKTLADVIKKS